MRYFVFVLAFSLISIGLSAQILNGAWRLIEKDGEPVLNETIKLYSNGYYTWSTCEAETGDFLSAGGGTYLFDFQYYEERCEVDSQSPHLSGKQKVYHATIDGDRLTLRLLKSADYAEVWEKFDGATNFEMATCWRIYLKRDAGDVDWRTIDYAPRKTLKMLTNSRYQVLALNSHTGQFVGSSGGTWDGEAGAYREHVVFFSKNPNNAGRTLHFNLEIKDGIWHHSGTQTDGDPLWERWVRYR